MYKLKKIKTKYKWFISYLFTLCIPILMSIVLLINMQISINKERAIEAKLQIENVIQRVENEVSLNKVASNHFKSSTILRSILESPAVTTAQGQELLQQLSREIGQYARTNQIDDKIYIYFVRFGIIVDSEGVFIPWEYWNRNYKSTDITYSDWKDIIERWTLKYGMSPVDWMDSASGKTGQSFLHTVPLIKKEAQNYAIMAVQSGNRVNYDDDMVHAHFIIYDDEGEAVYSLKDVNREMLPVLREPGEEKEQVVGGKRYVIERAHSEDTGFSFVVAMEMYGALSNVWAVMAYLSIIILVSLLCIWRLWKISDRNYTVIDEIVNRLKKYRNESSSDNEIGMINRLIDKIIAENEDKEKQIFKQKHQFAMLNISRLLKGSVTSFLSIQESLPPEEQLTFLSDSFAVIAVMLDDCSGFLENDEGQGLAENMELIRFAIRNVAEEIIGNHGNKAYFADMEEMPLFIVSLCEEGIEEGIETLTKCCNELQSFLKQQLKIFVTISISNIHQGLEGIQTAYQEALETMEYRFILGEGLVLTADHVEINRDSKYGYTQDCEIRLTNLIQSGNFSEAKNLIGTLLEFDGEHKPINLRSAQFMVYDIAATLIKLNDELAEEKAVKENEFLDSLMAEKDLDVLKTMLISATEKLCMEYEAASVNSLAKKVIRYIEDSYSNSDLSVAKIAEHFHFHPTYMSNMFKEQTGIGLLEFINKTRINKSVELLNNTSYSINVISKSVGYLNANTYIRIFKRIIGVTPSKYRNLKAE